MINLTLHNIYSEICLFSSPSDRRNPTVLKAWCEKITKHWEEKIESSAFEGKRDMLSYIEKFLDYFDEKLDRRISRYGAAIAFIDSLEINLGDYSYPVLLEKSIAEYTQRGGEKVDMETWRASRVYGVVEAYLRHTHTDYDAWLKNMKQEVRDRGAYEYLRKRIREELEKQYPDMYWYIVREQKALKVSNPKVLILRNRHKLKVG